MQKKNDWMHLQAAFTFGIIHHLLSLSTNYLELKTFSSELVPIDAARVILPDRGIRNMSYCEIPVRMPKSEMQVMTLVSPEDYTYLTSLAPTWRMNAKGYVVISKRVDGKYRLMYMHKEVAGGASKHLNGDRLDNRRENLVPSLPRRPFIELSPMNLHSNHPLHDAVKTAEEAMDFDYAGTHSHIQYDSNKVYSGETHNGLPHGLGTLLEKNRTSFGWFIYGQFKSGCVVDHPPVCDRLQYLYQNPPHVRPIADIFAVTPDNKHRRLY